MKHRHKLMLACGVALFVGFACRLGLNIVRYEIESEKITAPVKIAFISDLHNSLYGKGQCEIIDGIADFGTDIVLFGGDLFDEHNGEENSWALVDALVGKYPCFYAIGNHEIKTRKPDFYKEEMEKIAEFKVWLGWRSLYCGLFKTVYNGIEAVEGLAAGTKVAQGYVIGYVSDNNKQEYKDGPHLHFEVWQDGSKISPYKYLSASEK